ncbi:MAG: hypothetical protein ACI9OJ_004419, partial [Myxococcota bacterium]
MFFRVASLLIGLVAFAPLARADCRADVRSMVGGYINLAGSVDCPRLRRAIERLPAGARPRLRQTRVVRLEYPSGAGDLTLGDGINRSRRLVTFHPLTRTIVVTQAGYTGKVAWRGGRATVADTAAWLEGIAKDGDSRSISERWTAQWKALGGAGPAPPIGSAELFDREVAAGKTDETIDDALFEAIWLAATMPRGIESKCPCEERLGNCPERSSRSAEPIVGCGLLGQVASGNYERLAPIARRVEEGPKAVADVAPLVVLAVLLPAQLLEPRWQTWLRNHAQKLMWIAEPAALDILRQHKGSLLGWTRMDQPRARWPRTAPASLEAFGPERFEVRIGHTIARPPPARVERWLRGQAAQDASGVGDQPPAAMRELVQSAEAGAGTAHRLIATQADRLGRLAPELRRSSQHWLAVAWAHVGHVTEALALARGLVGEGRVSTLAAVGDVRLRRGDFSGTFRALEQLEVAIRNLEGPAAGQWLARVVEIQAAMGLYGEALRLIGSVGITPAQRQALTALLADLASADVATAERPATEDVVFASELAEAAERQNPPTSASVSTAAQVTLALVRTAGTERALRYAQELPFPVRGVAVTGLANHSLDDPAAVTLAYTETAPDRRA